jgi:2-methylisocitrate lyase-like PEP mutase family enzyme
VEAVMRAAGAAGVPDFVLNARTDVVLRAGDRPAAAVLADAVERGRAYLDAGAPVVFVPGPLTEEQIGTLVEALGPQRLSVIGFPTVPPPARLETLGVARISYGPLPQRAALTALQRFAEDVLAGGTPAADLRALN